MSSELLISVVMTTYNRKDIIARSIRSVLEQTYSTLELVVVDDGSVDGTKEHVAQAFSDPRVRYEFFSHNCGATVARNHGIDQAKGEFILVWDSDDELYPQALETLVTQFRNEPILGVVSAPARSVYRDGSIEQYRKVDSGRVSLDDILCKKLPNNEKVRLVRREVFEGVRYKAKNIDFLVNVDLAAKAPWYHINDELGTVYLESDQTSLTKGRKRPDIGLSIARASYLQQFLRVYGDRLKRNCPERYADNAYGAAVGLLLAGFDRESRDFAREASRLRGSLKYFIFSLFCRLPYSGRMLVLLFKYRKIMSTLLSSL